MEPGPSQRIGRARHTSSLYDYVKVSRLLTIKHYGPPDRLALVALRVQVRVWLGDRADPGCHSHVLSRFLIARTLMATQVHFSTAVKVALEVKKYLVDTDQLEIGQAQLEAAIFKFMRRRSLPEDCIFQYKLLSAFHQRRQALIVLVAGGVLCHKSTISAQLAQRMNLGNVLDVDCVARLLLPLDAGDGQQTSSLGADGPNQQLGLTYYDDACLLTRQPAYRYAHMGGDVAGARELWTEDCNHVFKGARRTCGLRGELGACPGCNVVACSGVRSDLAKCLHVRSSHCNCEAAFIARALTNAPTPCRMAKQL
jgi:hypothetical protein